MPRLKFPIAPMAVYGVLKELRGAAAAESRIAVGGAPALADVLRRELGRGAAPGAVGDDSLLAGVAALVYVLAGAVGEEDERRLDEASKARVPVVAVLTTSDEDGRVPNVLATDIVRVPPGKGFPLDEIAVALARRLEEAGVPVATRVPVLRRAVCEWLIAKASRQNAVVGVVVFIPGADFPAMTMNQLRLVLRIAAAHGFPIGRARLPEVLGVIGTGLGFRTFARQLLGAIPVAGWAVKGGVGYVGTKALGEAALRLFEARAAEESSLTATPRPASASRAAS
jgi:uncharacterized protein (DUF697 family)